MLEYSSSIWGLFMWSSILNVNANLIKHKLTQTKVNNFVANNLHAHQLMLML